MLPYDKTITPPLTYECQYPPYLPFLNIPDELLIARDYIAAQISNMVGAYAHMNPARIFCYNTLVYGNFDNDAFREVYCLVCGLLLHRQRKGNLNDIRHSANECIYQVLQLYTAHLCNNNPEVMRQLDVNQLQGVKESTVSFQDIKAIMVSEFNKRDPAVQSESDYVRWATDIIYKCKDLYTLTPTDLMHDCKFTHSVLQKTPFKAKDLKHQKIFNPSGTIPLVPPGNFKPIIQPRHHSVIDPTTQRPHMFPNQYNPPPITAGIQNQSPPQLTPEVYQNGLPLPKTDQEARLATDGYDINYPELGYFPTWHPGHSAWLQRRELKYKETRDRVAVTQNQRYGTPLPDHLKPQGINMQQQQWPQQPPQQQWSPQPPQQQWSPQPPQQQPPQQQQQWSPQPPQQQPPQQQWPQQPPQQQFQQPLPAGYPQYPPQPLPAGYHQFNQAPSIHPTSMGGSARFGTPAQQGFGAPQQSQVSQGMWTPDVPQQYISQLVAQYQDGSRVILTTQGQQVLQQWVVPHNLNLAMGNGGQHNTFMQPQSPGGEQYDNISAAVRTSMNRWDNKPIPMGPIVRQPAEVQVAPSSNNDYFHRGIRTPEPTTGRNSQPYQDPSHLAAAFNQQGGTGSGAADELANQLINDTCNAEEQMAARGWVATDNDQLYPPKTAATLAWEASMKTNLPFEPVVQPHNKPKPRTYVSSPSDFMKRKLLTMQGDNEVDRAKHQIIKFGGAVRYPLQPKFDALKESTERLSMSPAVVVKPEPISEVIKNEAGEEETIVVEAPEVPAMEYMIYPTVVLDLTLDAAMITSRALKLEHMRVAPDDKVFRSFGASCELLLSNADIEDHVNALRHTRNFNHLVATIKKIVNQQYAESQERQDIQLVMAEVDRKLTEKTNEFLQYKLGVSTRIDEFSTDIVDLRAHLMGHYQEAVYGEAFDRFEQEIMTSISNEADEDDIKTMTDAMRVGGVYSSYFPFMYSFTHINLTAEELGFTNVDFRDTTLQLTLRDHESLYKLVHTLDMNKYARQLSTITDYLITSDGVRYRLFVNYLDNETFTIARDMD